MHIVCYVPSTKVVAGIAHTGIVGPVDVLPDMPATYWAVFQGKMLGN
jgi:hypothetical protein